MPLSIFLQLIPHSSRQWVWWISVLGGDAVIIMGCGGGCGLWVWQWGVYSVCFRCLIFIC